MKNTCTEHRGIKNIYKHPLDHAQNHIHKVIKYT